MKKPKPYKPWVSVVPQSPYPFALALHSYEFTPEDARAVGAVKGGKANKKALAIMALVRIYAQTGMPVREIFNTFPLSEASQWVKLKDGEYEVYRDGELIIQRAPDASVKEIRIRTLERYIGEARKKSKITRRKPRTK